MTRRAAPSFIPWLLLVVVALIAYGSLYPFNFKPDAVDGGVLRAFMQLSWQRAGRGDRISNVLLYLPLGFCLFLLLAARFKRAAALALAAVLGALLSLTIEAAQAYISPRVPSLTDLALNALGSLAGAAGGLAWRALSSLLHAPARAEAPARDSGAALLLALWFAWRFAPFTPQFDLAKLKSALQPLFHPQFEPAAAFGYLTCWLVVNQAIAGLVSRPRRLEALLITIAVVLIGRLLLVNQAFAPAELLALLLLLPLIVLMHRLAPAPRHTALALAVIAAVLIEGLAPFDFATNAARFDLWPFTRAHLDFSYALRTIDWAGSFGCLFLSAALIWSLREWGAPLDLAIGVAVALVLLIEVMQMWLPQRESTIAAPLLTVAAGLTLRALYRKKSGWARG